MNKQVILIVGATSAIGKACAHILKDKQLILMGRDNNKLTNLLQELNIAADIYVVDVASELEINNCVEHVLNTYNQIDAVIYNTAIYPISNVELLSHKEWCDTLDINLSGAFSVAKACIPIMKKQNSGKFVFISSTAGEIIGLPGQVAYATSKAGLNGLMRTLAIELAPFNINVNSISPGKVFDASTLSQEEILHKLRPIPLKRFIDPEDIAYMVQFLLSEKGKNITGQNFIIDGGQSILGEDSYASKTVVY